MAPRIMLALFITLATLTFGGCATSFSSIQAREDGSYTLTRVKRGCFKVTSSIYNCSAADGGLSCNTIDD